MKKPFIFHAILFCVCLALGYPAGLFLGTHYNPARGSFLSAQAPASDRKEPTPIASLPNGQQTIMLILADQVDVKSPRLEGIWLMSYVADYTTLNFLPVYPSGHNSDPEQTNDLPHSFSISGKASLPELTGTFIQALQRQVPWWSGYILLDETSLTKLVDAWFVDTPLAEGAQDPSKILSGIFGPSQDAQAAIAGQAALFQELCWAASRHSEPVSLDRVLTGESAHILSDLSDVQVLSTLEGLQAQMSKFSCEFPTLAIPGSAIKQ